MDIGRSLISTKKIINFRLDGFDPNKVKFFFPPCKTERKTIFFQIGWILIEILSLENCRKIFQISCDYISENIGPIGKKIILGSVWDGGKKNFTLFGLNPSSRKLIIFFHFIRYDITTFLWHPGPWCSNFFRNRVMRILSVGPKQRHLLSFLCVHHAIDL